MRAAVYLLTVAAALLISAQNTGADGKLFSPLSGSHCKTTQLYRSLRSLSGGLSAMCNTQHWLARADPCVAATLNMVSVCGTFVTKVQNDAKLLGAATDAQIKDAASQGVQPSTQ